MSYLIYDIENYEEIINNIDKEIFKLKKKIKELEKDSPNNTKLIEQYKNMLKKKTYYQNKCKQSNEKIWICIDKLTHEQRQEFINFFNSIKDNNLIEISQSGDI